METKQQSKTYTRGNIIVEEIQVGDIHYEYLYNYGAKLKVLTLPEKNEDGAWVWKSENLKTGKEVNYLIHPEWSHYSPKLYDFEAYKIKEYI